MFILALVLLPLGVIALLASVETARENRQSRVAATRVVVGESAARLSATIGRLAVTMRATATALSLDPAGTNACRRTLDELGRSGGEGMRFALFRADGRYLCGTAGFRPERPATPAGAAFMAAITPDASGVVVTVGDATGTVLVVGRVERAALAQLARPASDAAVRQLTLTAGRRSLPLLSGPAGEHRAVAASAPVAGGRLILALQVDAAPIRPAELLAMILPIAMLIAAAIVGWVAVDRLLVQPLVRLQAAVAAYRPGRALALPVFVTPATEIRRLSRAFVRLTETVRRHEAELEEGIARQKRLTREVHHRVKNNLQVVASLINLHARGAREPGVRDAYAAILRRVDALAIVHRNHYAEYEQNKGVALRPLVQELASNLRASAAGEGASAFAVAVAIDPLHCTQDTAVAVSFLITEAVEMALTGDPAGLVSIRLARGEGHSAELAISSTALRDGARPEDGSASRFARVMEGLARQLRGKLSYDGEIGRYSLPIAVLD